MNWRYNNDWGMPAQSRRSCTPGHQTKRYFANTSTQSKDSMNNQAAKINDAPRSIAHLRSIRGQKPAARTHADTSEYRRWLRTAGASSTRESSMAIAAERFQEKWPDLESWFHVDIKIRSEFRDQDGENPLLPGESHSWMPYLKYLSIIKGVSLDYPFLFSRSFTSLLMDQRPGPSEYGIDMNVVTSLRTVLDDLGYGSNSKRSALNFCLGRILLHKGTPSIRSITNSDIETFRTAIYEVCDQIESDGIRSVYFRRGSASDSANSFRSTAKSRAFLFHQAMFQTGLVDAPPKPKDPRIRRYTKFGTDKISPGIAMTFSTYCRILESRGELAASTQDSIAMSLHTFGRFLYRDFPTVDSVEELTRSHVEAFLTYMRHEPSPVTGRLYSTTYQKRHISHLVRMFEEMHSLGYIGEGTLGIVSRLDMPKSNLPLPRYLTTSELDQLDAQIDAWPQPEQRAALLVLRWTGARRDEVRRLTIDALGSYPDGQPKLRIPAGKTGREREVPLHPKAAAALQEVIDARKRVAMRGLYDDRAARTVKHLFVKRGRLPSHQFLIDYPLREICLNLGLVDDQGRPIVTSHRFRHTVGTQMAENGAQLQTIMSMLGHSTPYTALIYARMSDSSIREQYNSSILGAESALAGPGVEILKQMTMSDTDVDWLKTNYLKTSLELGHCLRLPQEGPCECDLYLSCSKFVTSSEYLPRLRDAAVTQARLIEDAQDHGWLREVERHQRRLSKIHQLISDLEGCADGKSQPARCTLADEA